ncbi:MAG: HAMP domain-containing protein, partial [Clostridia bacterium]|nr:HAMP domain-containing protein [Clostridia bacterium]
MKRSAKMKNERRVRLWRTLRWRLMLFVLGIILVSGLLTALVHLFLATVFAKSPLMLAITVNPYVFTLVLLGVCTVIGTALAVFLGKYYLLPLKRLSLATREVKKGNFKVQVKQENHAMSEMGILVSDFNDMVRELDSIELFRNDFINNFSHEFKTPIVSIRGFARELERGELNEATRAEY